ncbi:MAG: hypothetical protein ACKO4T_10265 [Planctomycetaceae bacterium]
MNVAVAAVMTLIGLTAAGGVAAAAPPTAADVGRLVKASATRPSVHADRDQIDATLLESGVTRDTLQDLWHEVDAAILPGMGSRLDGFLFQTRDPRWRPLRDRFAEFLTLTGVEQVTKPVASRLKHYGGVISFPDVVDLDAESARRLRGLGAEDWGTAVEFPAVRTLSAATAAAIARCGGLVVFPALRELPADVAAALARHEGTGLVLGGFPRLQADAAEALARCQSMQGLLLPDLESLDSISLARRLSAQDSVFLPRIARLTPEVAEALRGNDGGMLALPGLKELPIDVARLLVGSGYYGITLGGAATLDRDTAAVLAGQPGPLTFTGTSCPSPDVARSLDAHAGELIFAHVRGLPADVATALGGSDHLLVLPGVTRLDAADAATLTPVGPLALPGLSSLDAAAAQPLAAHRHMLQLGGLRTLSSAAARELAAHPGDLMLSGLTSLDAATAAALAPCRGHLHLDAVVRLEPAAAAALLARDGPLSISGLQATTQLDSVELARLIASRIDDPVLPLVTAIDGPDAVAIAKAVAASRGVVSLPGLERITSRALAALLQRADLEIPAVADLEVVPDGDGGADDYAVPEQRPRAVP